MGLTQDDPTLPPVFCQLGLHKWKPMKPFPVDHPYSMTTRMLTVLVFKRQRCVRPGCGEHRLKKRRHW